MRAQRSHRFTRKSHVRLHMKGSILICIVDVLCGFHYDTGIDKNESPQLNHVNNCILRLFHAFFTSPFRCTLWEVLPVMWLFISDICSSTCLSSFQLSHGVIPKAQAPFHELACTVRPRPFSCQLANTAALQRQCLEQVGGSLSQRWEREKRHCFINCHEICGGFL